VSSRLLERSENAGPDAAGIAAASSGGDTAESRAGGADKRGAAALVIRLETAINGYLAAIPAYLSEICLNKILRL
jgi:hypothetical protein